MSNTKMSGWKQAILINLSDRPISVIYYNVDSNVQQLIYVDTMQEAIDLMQKVQDDLDMDNADHMGEQ
jgi:hypothetical protein